MPKTTLYLTALLIMTMRAACTAETQETIYDEANVPAYTLPDPLTMPDGTPVSDAATWHDRRRPEILQLFEQHVYGTPPGRPAALRFETRSVDTTALGGTATRKEIALLFTENEDGPRMDLLVYLPNRRTGPVPAFIGLNFYSTG